MKENNLIYNYNHQVWHSIFTLYNWYGDSIIDMFTKYTIKQQNQIRMKQLLGESQPNEIHYKYIEYNIHALYNYNRTIQNIYHLMHAYYELTEYQFNTYFQFREMSFTHEQAFHNASTT